jgi:hypothetical protein
VPVRPETAPAHPIRLGAFRFLKNSVHSTRSCNHTFASVGAHLPRIRDLSSLGSRVQKSKKATVGSLWVIGLIGPPAGNILHFIDLANDSHHHRHCGTLIVQRGATIALTRCLNPTVDLELPLPLQSRAPGEHLRERHSWFDVIFYASLPSSSGHRTALIQRKFLSTRCCMRFNSGWTRILTGGKESPPVRAPGHELWEEILASAPPRLIPLVCCEGPGEIHTDRLDLSDGTISAGPSENDEVEYNPGAFLPRKPWRKPTDWERKRLWQNSWVTDVAFVGVASIPNELLAPLRNLVNDTDTDALRQLEPRRIREFIGPFVDYLRDRFAYKTEPFNHGIHVHRPGLETVTLDPANRKFLGLHLDSWDRYPLEVRARSLNRICVNIGAEPRHFLFLNLSLMNVARLLAQESQQTLDLAPESVGPAFMSRFPGYPIVRVRIDPGEAYIAPTDNVIHDASTIGSEGLSITLTLRGWFTVPSVQACSVQ